MSTLYKRDENTPVYSGSIYNCIENIENFNDVAVNTISRIYIDGIYYVMGTVFCKRRRLKIYHAFSSSRVAGQANGRPQNSRNIICVYTSAFRSSVRHNFDHAKMLILLHVLPSGLWTKLVNMGKVHKKQDYDERMSGIVPRFEWNNTMSIVPIASYLMAAKMYASGVSRDDIMLLLRVKIYDDWVLTIM